MYTLKTNSTHWNSANIYGSSRVGMYEPNKLIGKFGVKVTNSNNISTLTRGLRRYELSNHLGNVLAVISDKRTTVCNGVLINYYEADVVYSTDYHSFGSSMAGRNFSNASYRFGWNGKETEKEIFEGCITFEARIYNSHLGRFLSTDPRESEYPWQSTYVYFSNSPISILDLLGKGGPYQDDGSDPVSSISNSSNASSDPPKTDSRDDSRVCKDDKRLSKWRSFRYQLKNGSLNPFNKNKNENIKIRRWNTKGTLNRKWNPTHLEGKCDVAPGGSGGEGPKTNPADINVVTYTTQPETPEDDNTVAIPPNGTLLPPGAVPLFPPCITVGNQVIDDNMHKNGVINQKVNFIAPPGATNAILYYVWQDMVMSTATGLTDDYQNNLTIFYATDSPANWNWNSLTGTTSWAAPTGNGNNITLNVSIGKGVVLRGMKGIPPDRFKLIMTVCFTGP